MVHGVLLLECMTLLEPMMILFFCTKKIRVQGPKNKLTIRVLSKNFHIYENIEFFLIFGSYLISSYQLTLIPILQSL